LRNDFLAARVGRVRALLLVRGPNLSHGKQTAQFVLILWRVPLARRTREDLILNCVNNLDGKAVCVSCSHHASLPCERVLICLLLTRFHFSQARGPGGLVIRLKSVIARHCFSRTLHRSYLMPAAPICLSNYQPIRCKLNIQEVIKRLSQSPNTSSQTVPCLRSTGLLTAQHSLNIKMLMGIVVFCGVADDWSSP
jgi:hypothetical protein